MSVHTLLQELGCLPRQDDQADPPEHHKQNDQYHPVPPLIIRIGVQHTSDNLVTVGFARVFASLKLGNGSQSGRVRQRAAPLSPSQPYRDQVGCHKETSEQQLRHKEQRKHFGCQLGILHRASKHNGQGSTRQRQHVSASKKVRVIRIETDHEEADARLRIWVNMALAHNNQPCKTCQTQRYSQRQHSEATRR